MQLQVGRRKRPLCLSSSLAGVHPVPGAPGPDRNLQKRCTRWFAGLCKTLTCCLHIKIVQSFFHWHLLLFPCCAWVGKPNLHVKANGRHWNINFRWWPQYQLLFFSFIFIRYAGNAFAFLKSQSRTTVHIQSGKSSVMPFCLYLWCSPAVWQVRTCSGFSHKGLYLQRPQGSWLE